MPQMDGVEVCRTLRSKKQFKDTLIAFLTAREEDYSQIAALDLGGDDYITKPIRPRLLISRIKALLRRATRMEGQDTNSVINIGDLALDKEKFEVSDYGSVIEVIDFRKSTTEFKLREDLNRGNLKEGPQIKIGLRSTCSKILREELELRDNQEPQRKAS